MPKSKEFISSGSESDGEPRSKKSKAEAKASKPKSSSSSGDSDMIQLGKMKYASVTEFKGKKYVNIREYYTDGSGDLKPGRKGIMLPKDQWEILKDSIEDLDAQLNS